MVKTTRRRTGELVRKAFEVLLEYPHGLPAQAVFERIEQTFSLSELERSRDPVLPRVQQFEETTRFGMIGPIKAGWLFDYKDHWLVTVEGRRAYAKFDGPERFLLEAGRLSFKGWLAVHAPGFYSCVCWAIDQLSIEYNLVRRLGFSQLFRQLFGKVPGIATTWQKVLPLQMPRHFVVSDLQLNSIDELWNHLDSTETAYQQGGHTVYLSPASVQHSPFQAVMRHYPLNAGLKISKNPGGVQESTYVFGDHRRRKISVMYKNLVYGHSHMSLVANLLYSHEIGPRLYDVVELQCGDQSWTAYVIEDVGGRAPSFSECEAGLKKIRELERQGLIKVNLSDGYEDEDFICPTCKNNTFIENDRRFQYVDFQNFLLPHYESYLQGLATRAVDSSHFGDSGQLRGGRHLYQSIPGVELPARRDTHKRIDVFKHIMASAGVSIQDRLVLDIGCSIGMMMAQYLRLGARWCHGWDQAQVTFHTERLLLALGCTRFSLTGGEVKRTQQLETDLPGFLKPALDGCVISYLAPYGALGWLDALAKIPWSFLIYESHEDDTEEDFEGCIAQLRSRVSFHLAAMSRYRDGDCEQRTAAILVRV